MYNKPEDFYQVVKHGNIPQYDVLITNPPYSSDHLDKLLGFLESNDKPALLLLPEHLPKKSSIYSEEKFCFLSPPERYHYWTPEGMRVDQENNAKKKNQHMNLILGRRNSPFVSYWFISMRPIITNDELLSLVSCGDIKLVTGCKLNRCKVDIDHTNFKGDKIDGAYTREYEDKKKKKRSKKRKYKSCDISSAKRKEI